MNHGSPDLDAVGKAAEREWGHSAALQSEFADKSTYVAYRKAEARGAVRLLAPRATSAAIAHGPVLAPASTTRESAATAPHRLADPGAIRVTANTPWLEMAQNNPGRVRDNMQFAQSRGDERNAAMFRDALVRAGEEVEP